MMRPAHGQDSMSTLAAVAAGLAEGRHAQEEEDADYLSDADDVDHELDDEQAGEDEDEESHLQRARGNDDKRFKVTVKRSGSKRVVTRRPVQFWASFNDWWRSVYEGSGKRPSSEQIEDWYVANVSIAWPDGGAPSLAETRTHAKCLRSVDSIRDYFRTYRARKKCKKEGDALQEYISKAADLGMGMGMGAQLPLLNLLPHVYNPLANPTLLAAAALQQAAMAQQQRGQQAQGDAALRAIAPTVTTGVGLAGAAAGADRPGLFHAAAPAAGNMERVIQSDIRLQLQEGAAHAPANASGAAASSAWQHASRQHHQKQHMDGPDAMFSDKALSMGHASGFGKAGVMAGGARGGQPSHQDLMSSFPGADGSAVLHISRRGSGAVASNGGNYGAGRNIISPFAVETLPGGMQMQLQLQPGGGADSFSDLGLSLAGLSPQAAAAAVLSSAGAKMPSESGMATGGDLASQQLLSQMQMQHDQSGGRSLQQSPSQQPPKHASDGGGQPLQEPVVSLWPAAAAAVTNALGGSAQSGQQVAHKPGSGGGSASQPAPSTNAGPISMPSSGNLSGDAQRSTPRNASIGTAAGMRDCILKGLETCSEMEAQQLLQGMDHDTLVSLVIGALAMAKQRRGGSSCAADEQLQQRQPMGRAHMGSGGGAAMASSGDCLPNQQLTDTHLPSDMMMMRMHSSGGGAPSMSFNTQHCAAAGKPLARPMQQQQQQVAASPAHSAAGLMPHAHTLPGMADSMHGV